MLTNEKFYSGTSGLQIPVPRTQYPREFQEKSRLAYYASLFNSFEVNSTFYKLPRISTIVNWKETVPENFRFTFKLSKSVTHVKGLEFSSKDVNDFVNVVENVGKKKGCLLAQFPPSLKIEKMNQLQNLLQTLGQATHDSAWKIAIEFRDPSWYEREVYELLEEYQAVLVIHDIPKSATPLEAAKGDLIYLRFHGPEPRYRGDYAHGVLAKYAGYIREWVTEKKTVYAFFNNTVGAAVENLQTLNSFVKIQAESYR